MKFYFLLEIILKWFSRGYPISHPDVASIFFVSLRSTKNSEKSRNTPKYPEISWNIRKIQRRHLGVWEGASIYVSSRFFVYPRSLKNLKIFKKSQKIWKYLEKCQNPKKSLKQMSVKSWNVPKNILKARKIQNFLLPEISFKWFSRV